MSTKSASTIVVAMLEDLDIFYPLTMINADGSVEWWMPWYGEP